MNIETVFLPSQLADYKISDSTVVIIDILRASTTICTALDNGAKQIFPCLEVLETKALRSENQVDFCGGERGGIKIEGFDFGNSPANYDSNSVNQKSIAFTTTNGTKALNESFSAKQILIGSFVNLGVLCAFIKSKSIDSIMLVCAGTDNVESDEDILFAGALAGRLLIDQEFKTKLDRRTEIAIQKFESQVGDCFDFDHEKLHEALRNSQGGKNLIALGYDSDIKLASSPNSHPVIPIYSQTTNAIAKAC